MCPADHMHTGEWRLGSRLHSIYTFPQWRISNPFQSASECEIRNMLLQDVLTKNAPTQLQDATTWMLFQAVLEGDSSWQRLGLTLRVQKVILMDEIIIRTQDRCTLLCLYLIGQRRCSHFMQTIEARSVMTSRSGSVYIFCAPSVTVNEIKQVSNCSGNEARPSYHRTLVTHPLITVLASSPVLPPPPPLSSYTISDIALELKGLTQD